MHIAVFNHRTACRAFAYAFCIEVCGKQIAQ